MSAVHTLSKHMAVVCTVHQPSQELTTMFDDILLMKDGGEIVYFGPMQQLVTYFAHNKLGECPPGKNPVDFALEQLKRCNEISKKGAEYREEDERKRQEEKERQSGGLLKQLSRKLSVRGEPPPIHKQRQLEEEARDRADDYRSGRGGQRGRDPTKSGGQDSKINAQDSGEDGQHDDAAQQPDLEKQGPRDQQQARKQQGKQDMDSSEFEDLSPERARKLPQLFIDSPYYETVKQTLEAGVMPEDEKAAYRPPDLKSSHANFFTQVAWLSYRFNTNVRRNLFGIVIRYFLILVFVFFVGTIFLRLGYSDPVWVQERVGVIFLVLINVMFSTNAFLPEIYFNRPIYFREVTANMYSPEAYFIARYIGDAPYVVVECFLYSLIYWFVGLNPYNHSAHYGFFFWIILVLRWTGIAITHFFGTAIAAPDFAATLEITFFNVMLAMTGFLIPRPSMPSWWIWLYDVSFIRYALDTAIYFEFIHETFECAPEQAQLYFVGNDPPVCPTFGSGPEQDGQATYYRCPISCGWDVFNQYGVNPGSGSGHPELWHSSLLHDLLLHPRLPRTEVHQPRQEVKKGDAMFSLWMTVSVLHCCCCCCCQC